MTTKVCSKCGEEKPISEFGKDRERKDKLYVYCKLCTNTIGKESYQKNKEAKKESVKKYRKSNLEKVKETRKRWALKNPDKIKQKAKRWRIKNIEKARESTNNYRRNNLDKAKLREQNRVQSINDNYVAHILRISVKEFRELPEEVQHIHRTSIKIHRVLKQQKENQLL
jgi:hypothetical protein